MPQTSTLLSPSELSYLHKSLSLHPPIRPDARKPTSFRPLIAETDLLPSANGSARLCFADGAEAIVGIKGEVERTTTARTAFELQGEDREIKGLGNAYEEEAKHATAGDDKWVEVTVDVPGQRDDDAMVVFLSQMIHEGLVADGALRYKLMINSRWHWRLYVDVRTPPFPSRYRREGIQMRTIVVQILLLSPPQTYPLPLLSLTTHLALLATRLPACISTHDEDPLFNDDWDASIPLYASCTRAAKSSTPLPRPPVTLLVISVGQNIFFDPTHSELAVADAVLAVTVGTFSDPSEKGGLDLLALRTIDPPSRTSAIAGDVETADQAEEGVWSVRKGGLGRAVLTRIVGLCVEKGGVGEEVLNGLDGFT